MYEKQNDYTKKITKIKNGKKNYKSGRHIDTLSNNFMLLDWSNDQFVV